MILAIRTDKPEAEVGLFDNELELTHQTWQAHRQLAETIHLQIVKVLQSVGKDLNDVQGIVAFKGPGSFTGLRIGLTVGNALAYSLGIPIVSEKGDDWIQLGVKRLQNHESETAAMPEYGSPVSITLPKK